MAERLLLAVLAVLAICATSLRVSRWLRARRPCGDLAAYTAGTLGYERCADFVSHLWTCRSCCDQLPTFRRLRGRR